MTSQWTCLARLLHALFTAAPLMLVTLHPVVTCTVTPSFPRTLATSLVTALLQVKQAAAATAQVRQRGQAPFVPMVRLL